jgi:hypothetical protein
LPDYIDPRTACRSHSVHVHYTFSLLGSEDRKL